MTVSPHAPVGANDGAALAPLHSHTPTAVVNTRRTDVAAAVSTPELAPPARALPSAARSRRRRAPAVAVEAADLEPGAVAVDAPPPPAFVTVRDHDAEEVLKSIKADAARELEAIAAEAAEASPRKPSRPEIVVQVRRVEYSGGQKIGATIERTPIPTLARAGVEALKAAEWGELVFVDPDTAPAAMVHVLPTGSREHEGAPLRVSGARRIVTSAAVLRGWLSGAARWVNNGAGQQGNEEHSIDPPEPVVAYALGAVEGLRPLRGIVEAPVMRRDGSIIDAPGYDPATQLFAAFDGEATREALDAIPKSPTQADAAAALQLLHGLVRDFPFEAPEHRATWCAGLLTMFSREAFTGPAPLFMVNANVQGTGKSLLSEIPGRIMSGQSPAMLTWTGDDIEFKKQVTSEMIAGTRCIIIDNITGKFRSPTLDKIITSGMHRDRMLGGNILVAGVMVATWWGSANNIDPSKDQGRRIAPIELVSRVVCPEDRKGFAADGTDGEKGEAALRAFVDRNRWGYVAAVLTILRAWYCAGRPDGGGPAWGSFSGWSRVVRGALVFAGDTDPGKAHESFRDLAATDTSTLRTIIEGWALAQTRGVIPPHGAPLARVAKVLTTETAAAARDARDDRGAELRDALEACAGGEPIERWRGVPEPVSKFFRDHKRARSKLTNGRIACINTGKLSAGSMSWTIEFAEKAEQPFNGGDGGDGGDVSKVVPGEGSAPMESDTATSPPSQPSPPLNTRPERVTLDV